jgi:O-antigen ligase
LVPGHYFPWVSFQQEAVAAIGLFVVSLSTWAFRSNVVHWPLIAKAALATSLVPLTQWLFGEVRFMSDAVLAWAYVASFALSIVVGATLAGRDRERILEALTGAMVVGAIASAGIGLTQWLRIAGGAFLDGLAPGGRVYANFGQPNHLATVLALGIACLLYFYERRRTSGPTTSLGVAFLGWALVLTQSRTGWLFVALLSVWLILMRRRAGLRISVIAVVVADAMFVLGLELLTSLNELLQLTGGFDAAERLQPGTRWRHWQTMWDAIWQRPWTGWGWTQVMFAQQAAALNHPFTGEALNSSHDILLDLLVWNGVPLGVALIALLSYWFVRQVRRCRNGTRATLVAAVSAILLHALLEYPLNYAYFLFPLGLLMGLLDGLDEDTAGRAAHRLSLGAPALLIAAVLSFAAYEYVQVEASQRTLRFVVFGIGTDRVSTAPEPEVHLLDRPLALHRYLLSQAREGMSNEEIEKMHDVAMLHPGASSMYRYALILGINGRPKEAALTLARLCKMHPVERCIEARDTWPALQKRYPALRGIAPPTVPIEALPPKP